MKTVEQSNLSASSSLIETPPSAGRMAVAIAGYPYSAKAAVLDIVDNAVDAASDRISILLEQSNKELKSIAVVDNGTGITPKILDEVLRAGSRTSHLYGKQSLSRYGIGLKGAGFSLGSRLTLLTQAEGHPLMRRSIDLDYIQQQDKWIQDTREPDAEDKRLFQAALAQLPEGGQRQNGTVVLVEKLNIRSRDIIRLKNEVIRQLGETYAKFLSGTAASSLQISVLDNWERDTAATASGVLIEPVDPLHRENPSTLVLYQREEIRLDEGMSLFFSAAVLPHPNTLPIEVRRKYRYTQQDQGVYIFRNGRLVMGGQTLGLFGNDFHLNAFRAELEYTSAADEHVLVDVAKSNVTVTPEVFAKLQELVKVCTRTADTLWREKDILTEDDIRGLFDETNSLIGSRQRLIVDLARKRREQREQAEESQPPAGANGTKAKAKEKARKDIPYVRAKDQLSEDVLYRPIYDAELRSVVVDVNMAHPFSKAVFSVSPGEGKKSVPRKATTAVQQLLYVLGHVEYSLNEDEDNRELLNQFRRYASMNLRALLAD